MKNKTRKYVMPLLAALPALSVVSTGVALASCSNSESVALHVLDTEGLSAIDTITLDKTSAPTGSTFTIVVMAKSGYALKYEQDPVENYRIALYHDNDVTAEFTDDEYDLVQFDKKGNAVYITITEPLAKKGNIYVWCDTEQGIVVSNLSNTGSGDTSHFNVVGDNTFIPDRPMILQLQSMRDDIEGNNYKFYNSERYTLGRQAPDHESHRYPFNFYGVDKEGNKHIINEFIYDSYRLIDIDGDEMDLYLNITRTQVLAIEAYYDIDLVGIQVQIWMCQQYKLKSASEYVNVVGELWEDHGLVATVTPAKGYMLLFGQNHEYNDNSAISLNSGAITNYTYEVDNSRDYATLSIPTAQIGEGDINVAVDFTAYLTSTVTPSISSASKYIELTETRVPYYDERVPNVHYATDVVINADGMDKYTIADVWATQRVNGTDVEITAGTYSPKGSQVYSIDLTPDERASKPATQGYISGQPLTIHVELASKERYYDVNKNVIDSTDQTKCLVSGLSYLDAGKAVITYNIPVGSLDGIVYEDDNVKGTLDMSVWTYAHVSTASKALVLNENEIVISDVYGSQKTTLTTSQYTWKENGTILSINEGIIKRGHVLEVICQPSAESDTQCGTFWFWQELPE